MALALSLRFGKRIVIETIVCLNRSCLFSAQPASPSPPPFGRSRLKRSRTKLTLESCPGVLILASRQHMVHESDRGGGGVEGICWCCCWVALKDRKEDGWVWRRGSAPVVSYYAVWYVTVVSVFEAGRGHGVF